MKKIRVKKQYYVEYDTDQLKQEKKELKELLKMKKPNQDELVEYGKSVHPYYDRDKGEIKNRISEINSLLKA